MDLQPGSRNCWLKEYNIQGGRLPKTSCEKAEAAASVAIGRNSVRQPFFVFLKKAVTLFYNLQHEGELINSPPL